jgi:hypothetical protein
MDQSILRTDGQAQRKCLAEALNAAAQGSVCSPPIDWSVSFTAER